MLLETLKITELPEFHNLFEYKQDGKAEHFCNTLLNNLFTNKT